MSERIAIIPARGGSKRIPRKNIRPFAGKPVICHAIEAALASECFQEVMVSTDDREIALVAERAGAKIPFFRSAETSGDHSTTVDVIREVIKAYALAGRVFESGCCIYPVTPFLRTERLREAMELLEGPNPPETVVAALHFPHPVQRAFTMDEGRIKWLFPEYAQTRTQDLTPAFHDAAQFYAFQTRPMLARGALIGPASASICLPFGEAHDIDTPEDWAEAEMKHRLLREAIRG